MAKALKAATPTPQDVENLKTLLSQKQAAWEDEKAAHAATTANVKRLELALEAAENSLTTAQNAQAIAAAKPGTAPDVFGAITSSLMELPADSGIKKALQDFVAALIENYHDGPGAPGRSAFAILDAASNSADSAYKKVSVLERAAACTMASTLKGVFKK